MDDVARQLLLVREFQANIAGLLSELVTRTDSEPVLGMSTMISPRNRRHLMLLACGVLGLPILISFQQSPCCPSRAECGCASPGDFFLNLANAQSSDLEPPTKRPPLSDEAKAALQRLIEGNQRFV